MKKRIAIVVGKLFLVGGKLLKRGGSLPGKIALELDPMLLKKMKLPKKIIAVTGSSGKGSTSKMIASIFEEQGYQVIHNKGGANLTPGIATLLLEHTNLSGTIKGDILIYEIDERYTKFVFPYIKPQYVVISNITRDQPPRQGHFDLVFEEIEKAIEPNMHLILNGDDPYLRKFTIGRQNPVTYYGIEKNEYSYQENQFQNLNINYCPKCGSKLLYHFYHFESLGDYYCSKCSFHKPFEEYQVTSLNYEEHEMVINEVYPIKIPYDVLYCVYNTLSAFTTASILGLNQERTAQILSKQGMNQKNFDVFEYKNRMIHILNNKNENSSTFNQSIFYISRFQEPKVIVIGWKEISRRYQFDDLSWLYDIDFELLKKQNVTHFICVGIHRYDIATRLKYAGIKEEIIIPFDNLRESATYIKTKTDANVYAILNFDYVKPFKDVMKEEESA